MKKNSRGAKKSPPERKAHPLAKWLSSASISAQAKAPCSQNGLAEVDSFAPEKHYDYIPFTFGYLDESDSDVLIDHLFASSGSADRERELEVWSLPEHEQARCAIGAFVAQVDADPLKAVGLKGLLYPLLRCLIVWSSLPGMAESMVATCEYLIRYLDMVNDSKLAPVAQQRHAWPCLVAPEDLRDYKSKGGTVSLRRRLVELRLGCNTEIANPESQAASNCLALVIIDTIRRNQELATWKKPMPQAVKVSDQPGWVRRCATLPALSKPGAWEDWFKVGWEVVMDASEQHPEQHSKFKPLGEHRRRHSEHNGAQKKVTHGTAEANIRDGIKKALKAAFRRVLRTSC